MVRNRLLQVKKLIRNLIYVYLKILTHNVAIKWESKVADKTTISAGWMHVAPK